MKIDILTLFPNMCESFINESIIKRAIESEIVEINAVNIRDYSKDKHKKVDDTPYGGGSGMVLKCQPIFDAVKDLQKANTKVILMTPQGVKFNQKQAYNLSKEEHLILVCGHYEGFDERIRDICDMEISIGDYVLTGGELPSLVVTDAVVRLVDGVIDEESRENDSFNKGVLDYPNYTKPREYEGLKVPEVLISGHHKNIEKWRKEESIKRTKQRRPDLVENNKQISYVISKEKNGEMALIEYGKMNGYNLNPKNDAKREDVINVTKMVLIKPSFVEKVAKKNIEKKLQQLLKKLMIMVDEDDDNETKILDEAARLRSIINTHYSNILKDEYKKSIENRVLFIVNEVEKIKLKKEEEEKEKSGKSR